MRGIQCPEVKIIPIPQSAESVLIDTTTEFSKEKNEGVQDVSNASMIAEISSKEYDSQEPSEHTSHEQENLTQHNKGAKINLKRIWNYKLWN